jgi:hypothetical protein
VLASEVAGEDVVPQPVRTAVSGGVTSATTVVVCVPEDDVVVVVEGVVVAASVVVPGVVVPFAVVAGGVGGVGGVGAAAVSVGAVPAVGTSVPVVVSDSDVDVGEVEVPTVVDEPLVCVDVFAVDVSPAGSAAGASAGASAAADTFGAALPDSGWVTAGCSSARAAASVATARQP